MDKELNRLIDEVVELVDDELWDEWNEDIGDDDELWYWEVEDMVNKGRLN